MSTNLNQPNTPVYGGSGNNEGNNSKRLLTIAAIAIAALLGTNIFLLISKNNQGKQLETTVKELDSKEAAFDELNLRFTDAENQLTQLKGTNEELNAKIDAQIAQLTEQKTQIASMIRDKGDLKAARAQINDLVKQKDEYVLEVARLKEQVGQLTTANDQLTTEKTALTENLNATKTKLDEENMAKTALLAEKGKLETTAAQLTKKVDIASAVKVNTIEVKSLQISSKGKEKVKKSAKKTDKLSICFNTEANEVVDAGEETFYIRVIDPTGAPLAIESLGSGVASNKKTTIVCSSRKAASHLHISMEKRARLWRFVSKSIFEVETSRAHSASERRAWRLIAMDL